MNTVVIFAGAILLLTLGRPILIPMLVAIFLWYLINAVASYYKRAVPLRGAYAQNKWINGTLDWISIILAIATFVGVIYLFSTQVRPMFAELWGRIPVMQHKLVSLIATATEYFGVHLDKSMVPNITKFAANVGASAASLATSFGMILVYMLFMFVEQSTFHRKFAALITNKSRAKKVRYILTSIDENMKKYLFIKTLVSAMTGICAYAWLRIIGLEFAGVWAFIVFIMNYIPTIGSIIACILPILYSMATMTGWDLPILTTVGLIAMQVFFGNLLEPRLTGRSLNLSTLAILINLVFWGMIWGVAGMFFSVPLLVAIFIITAQFDSTRWVAVLLSADGKIPDKRDE